MAQNCAKGQLETAYAEAMTRPATSFTARTPYSLLPSEQSGAYLLHLSPLLLLLLPSIGHVLGPIVAWWMLKNSPTLDAQGKEVINFQLTVTLLHLALAILVFVLFSLGVLGGLATIFAPTAGIFSIFGALAGFLAVYVPLALLLSVYPVIVMLVGLVKAANGEFYRYPATTRFIR